MNAGLSKLGTALTVVFAATLAALVAQLLFLLWRRRKSQFPTRIGPHESHNPPGSQHTIDVDVDDMFKWQQRLYGVSSRVLFTIEEEEEREGLEVDSDTTAYSSCAEKDGKTTTVVLDVAVTLVRVEVEEEATTQFSTPCASPPYYTPSPSPGRDL